MKSKLSPNLHKNINQRLQRLEGQVRGIRRMLDENRDCQEILIQLSAIRGATHQISLLLAENYVLDCISHPESQELTDEAIARMVNTIGKLA